ncbi:UNVERIFIED_CONTAM: hypothetical protein K2H54_055319 [Gekko kuhli]
MSAGPSCHAAANVTGRPDAEVQRAGPSSPNTKMDTRLAVLAMEEQVQAAAAQKPLSHLPGLSGPKYPRVASMRLANSGRLTIAGALTANMILTVML